MRMNERARSLRPSPTLALDAKAKEAMARGQSILNFGVGEPDFDTPDYVKESGIGAIREGFTKYTAAAGILPLRRAIVDKLARDQGIDYLPEEIVVSAGAKHSLYNVFQMLLDEGDEVVILAPYWVSYPDQVRLCGGVPVVVAAGLEDGFVPSAASVHDAFTERTRAIVLNFPGNPSGAVPSRQQMEELLDVIEPSDAVIISDEIYEKLVYDGNRSLSPLSLRPQLKDRTVLVNGLSKSHAMTGWRVGYIAAPKPLAAAVADFQSQVTGSICSISQRAAETALRQEGQEIERMVAAFAKRRDLFVEGLREIDGVDVLSPQGAFYLFPRVTGLLGRPLAGGSVLQTSAQLAEWLLERGGIACVPGEPFGMAEHLRFSFACSEEQIVDGIRRLKELSRP